MENAVKIITLEQAKSLVVDSSALVHEHIVLYDNEWSDKFNGMPIVHK